MHLGGRFAQTVGDRFQRIARRSLAEERPGVLRAGEAFLEDPEGVFGSRTVDVAARTVVVRYRLEALLFQVFENFDFGMGAWL